MMHKQKRALSLGSAFALLGLVLAGCAAEPATDGGSATEGEEAAPAVVEEYPLRPITLIVPWSAGGGTDATGRLVAELLSEELGQPINVVNRTGAGGVVGHTAIATADSDGYTLGVITTELSMFNHAATTSLTFEDYSLVALYNEDPVALHVAASSDIVTAQDLVDAIAANPGKLNASGANFGGVAHLALVSFLTSHGLAADSVVWIPSEGSAPSLQELAAGTVQIVSTTLPEAASFVESGQARVVGVMADARLDSAPDVPTVFEQTGKTVSLGAWRGIAGPTGMPDYVVERLSEAMAKVVASDQFIEVMGGRGFGISYLNASTFTDFLSARDTSFGAALKAAGLAAG
jgi:tripartite-type tricarboxylate transporter receptor subunit TctC